ncbi:hypothetical protein A3709_18720 [Halioglobus sp. HI00S01]|uniref:hypothetical protein n=1 Tax=Halioglobus sp. HI00S01 TaxID=1822214 RepID=UPI0007C26EB0|nr:hypothetical protein [Halioglobus sp. HI00S01]KZX58107.1 hypothetical protein A3709_18720 [Halioglobus sp. HI00S01]
MMSFFSPREGQSRTLTFVLLVLLMVALGLLVADRLTPAGTLASISAETSSNESNATEESIAVLPFAALSNAEADAYFGEGLAEELLNSLAKLPRLQVAARTSAFAIAEQDLDLREMGRQLGVNHVLEGSLRRSGNRLRVTAQLIRVSDGFHLWSETYENESEDIFQVQDEIVRQISHVLQIRLGVGGGEGRAAANEVHPQAYEDYLSGLDYWWTRDQAGHRQAAIEKFMMVTEQDQDFADGWAAYAMALALSSRSFAPHFPAGTYIDSVEDAFNRALELDPRSHRALAALVYWHTNRAIDMPRAYEYLKRAEAAEVSNGFTYYTASQYYFAVGDEALTMRSIRQASLADPLNHTYSRHEFLYAAAFGDYRYKDLLLTEVASCTASDCSPNQWVIAYSAALAALHAADEQEIQRARDTLIEVYGALGSAGFATAHQEYLIAYMDRVLGQDSGQAFWEKADFSDREVSTLFTLDAAILARVGRLDEALDLLERIAEGERFFANRSLPYVLSEGGLEMPEDIRRHPRYHAIWARPGMPAIELARRSNGTTAGLPLPIL